MKQAGKIITTAATGLVILFGLTLNACKKAETGPAGKNGTDGNANVYSTGIVNLDSLWVYNSVDDFYTATLTSAVITQEVVGNGFVMAYIHSGNGGWLALPLSNLFTSGDIFAFEIVNGGVKFHYMDGNSSTTTTDISNYGLLVRVVIVPAQMKKPSVDYMNYEEVKEAYNL
jgi:hypothetical protein